MILVRVSFQYIFLKLTLLEYLRIYSLKLVLNKNNQVDIIQFSQIDSSSVESKSSFRSSDVHGSSQKCRGNNFTM